ncbi:Glutathione transport system permease protein GsiD [Sporomusa ovata DSM 2662]|uniref:Dipeptide transport system permease protein DppC (TC 3.A.1.5.2) n=1 Tax=Sporomusa ovata TaxID=2378 RepID=A0A0U1KTF4_9FIRM|nr:nickel transporter permease [Sporomusa ovata]EQB24981.1 ABC-type dipeptide/oligopeptide/nickel transport system, permease component [Sporomusa ovata DSM 2662]CQR70183.1 Dipeptide transport system permease protein DppC (TC 3.A.1.5.2) [Sporomusa ovata]
MNCQTNKVLVVLENAGGWKQLMLSLNVGLLALYLFVALFAPYIAPHDPLHADISLRLQPPSSEYLLGTDQLGRCLLSRLLWGTGNTLAAAGAVLACTVAAGTCIGLLAGFAGGWYDRIVQRILDGVMAFPGLILALTITGLLGPGLKNAAIALVLVHWVGYARIVRNMTFSLRERTYIAAAHTAGAKQGTILRRHILPAVMPTLAVLALLDFGRIILSIAGLSFLGLGAQPPVPEWGAMLSDGKPYLQAAPWLMLWPGIAIMGVVLNLQVLGEMLQQQIKKAG